MNYMHDIKFGLWWSPHRTADEETLWQRWFSSDFLCEYECLQKSQPMRKGYLSHSQTVKAQARICAVSPQPLLFAHTIWTATWENQQNGHCAQQRLRSAWVTPLSGSDPTPLSGSDPTEWLWPEWPHWVALTPLSGSDPTPLSGSDPSDPTEWLWPHWVALTPPHWVALTHWVAVLAFRKILTTICMIGLSWLIQSEEKTRNVSTVHGCPRLVPWVNNWPISYLATFTNIFISKFNTPL